jgi:serine/threonine protein kinase
MSLAPGERFGAYEIVSLIGAGGMGEVYRARDTKLNRDVAVKILPDLLAGDPDRLARFRREAQIVASLNHPNIAHVYGLEDAAPAGAAPVHALVMELVEGSTLAERIAEAPLALGDVMTIAAQLAEALEAAHEQGVVHRDLKPANIKVRADGVVKVLDFGLAKMVETGAVTSGSSASLSMSPTLSVHATFSGMILGTAAYMSPEQARGRTIDRRTDVWAFGCVLFEMLTGARAFEGEDIAETYRRGDPQGTCVGEAAGRDAGDGSPRAPPLSGEGSEAAAARHRRRAARAGRRVRDDSAASVNSRASPAIQERTIAGTRRPGRRGYCRRRRRRGRHLAAPARRDAAPHDALHHRPTRVPTAEPSGLLPADRHLARCQPHRLHRRRRVAADGARDRSARGRAAAGATGAGFPFFSRTANGLAT